MLCLGCLHLLLTSEQFSGLNALQPIAGLTAAPVAPSDHNMLIMGKRQTRLRLPEVSLYRHERITQQVHANSIAAILITMYQAPRGG